MQEALQKHATGVRFRERGAGPGIDQDMSDAGKCHFVLFFSVKLHWCLVSINIVIVHPCADRIVSCISVIRILHVYNKSGDPFLYGIGYQLLVGPTTSRKCDHPNHV